MTATERRLEDARFAGLRDGAWAPRRCAGVLREFEAVEELSRRADRPAGMGGCGRALDQICCTDSAGLFVVLSVQGVLVAAEEPVVVGFEEFYRAELDRQVRRCYLLTGSAEVANDIVHDAMLDVYRRWSSLDRPGAYLNTSVVNRCRDRARRERVGVRVAPLIATTDTSWDHSVADAVALDRALAGLPFNQRAALVLRFFADMTVDEIAFALGCRTGSVGPWIRRGLTALEKELS